MDAATFQRRLEAAARLKQLANEMREASQRMAADRAAIATGPLATAARGVWAGSLCLLEQASAGILVTGIELLASPTPGCPSPHLQAVRLSALQVAERRLRPPPDNGYCQGMRA